MIESRTSRASTGMQTPTGRPQQLACVNIEDNRALFLSWQTTGASPRATGGCILPRDADIGHSHAIVCRALQACHPQCSCTAALLLGPRHCISFVSAATPHVARIYILSISTAPNSAHRAWNLVRSIRASTDQSPSLASLNPSPLCNAPVGLATPLSQPTDGAPPRRAPP